LVTLMSKALSVEAIPFHDEIGHLLISRDGWSRPRLIFNTWGRTVHTILYMPVASFPVEVARVWSALMTVTAACLTWRVAVRAGIRTAGFVPLCFLLQTQTLDYGFLALTTTPLLLAGAMLLFLAQGGHWKSAALIAGLLPLMRHEAIALTGLFGLYLLWSRRWTPALLAAVPFVLNGALAFLLFGDKPWMEYFKTKTTDYWGSGGVWNFIQRFAFAVGLPGILLSLFGIAGTWRRPEVAGAAILGGAYFSIHAILFKFGPYATAGYTYFLFPLAPLVALLAAEGLEFLVFHAPEKLRPWLPDNRRSRGAFTVIAALLLCVWTTGYARQAQTFPIPPHEPALADAIDFIKTNGHQDADIVTSHVLFFWNMPRPIPHADDLLWINARPMESLQPGTLVIWEPYYSEIWRIKRSQLETDDFEVLWKDPNNEVVVYRRRLPPAPLTTPPPH
jgi:hypothetical protein